MSWVRRTLSDTPRFLIVYSFNSYFRNPLLWRISAANNLQNRANKSKEEKPHPPETTNFTKMVAKVFRHLAPPPVQNSEYILES